MPKSTTVTRDQTDPGTPVDDQIEKLRRLTIAYRDAKETLERHRDRWQQAIVDAVDDGMRPTDAGNIVGVSRARIDAIIARVYSRAE